VAAGKQTVSHHERVAAGKADSVTSVSMRTEHEPHHSSRACMCTLSVPAAAYMHVEKTRFLSVPAKKLASKQTGRQKPKRGKDRQTALHLPPVGWMDMARHFTLRKYSVTPSAAAVMHPPPCPSRANLVARAVVWWVTTHPNRFRLRPTRSRLEDSLKGMYGIPEVTLTH
jgi:hypothetical protein